MHDQIKELTKNIDKESSFDIDTIIDICRSQPETLNEAITIAKKAQNYKILVRIYIQDLHDNKGAIEIVANQVRNLHDKVSILREHVPVLLKYMNLGQNTGGHVTAEQMEDAPKLKKYLVQIVKQVAYELVYYKRNGDKFDEDSMYEMGSNQIIKIEDMLDIFADDMVCM